MTRIAHFMRWDRHILSGPAESRWRGHATTRQGPKDGKAATSGEDKNVCIDTFIWRVRCQLWARQSSLMVLNAGRGQSVTAQGPSPIIRPVRPILQNSSIVIGSSSAFQRTWQ
ncbi:hypothetical protein [Nocardia sp. NPDC059154]|uniref:hypothetical protein n=1 Tax=Nocardia sp. NPDC059154 TaxID=3346744 RepID=UPI003694E343